MSHRECSIDDCDRRVLSRGWCSSHYSRWLNAGKPDGWLTDTPDQRPPVTHDDVLAVARAHGSQVAAEWARLTPQHVNRLRHDAGDPDRGPGRPSTAELAARAPRLTCDCWYCIDWRSREAIRSNIRDAATRGGVIEPDRGWRTHAACTTTHPDVFFPDRVGIESLELYDEARAICARCPVTGPCLRFALDNHLDHGVYGGLDPWQRARIARDQPNDSDDDLRTQKRRGTRKPLTPDDERHGTINGYTNLGCRCEPCREANRANGQRQWAARRQTA